MLVCLATLLVVVAGCAPPAPADPAGSGSDPAGHPRVAGPMSGPDGSPGPDWPDAGSGRPDGKAPTVELTRDGRDGPPGPGPDSYQVRYGWAVPSDQVRIDHEVRPPVAPRPQPALPYLIEIDAADHPAAQPPFDRMTFAFRSGFPSYEVGYVPRVVSDGSGEPLRLPGNSFLQIRFVSAQAHDEQGRVSVRRSPRPELRLGKLRGYGFAGDFEGRVTYGLGIEVAAGSDQVLPVRVIEVTRDGLYIVAVDVRHG
jgi:hypothetical protein